MPLMSSLVSWFTLKRLKQIELFKEYPFDVQKEAFFNLITKARNTEWGKKYDYTSIDSIETFQERVPLSKYEDLEEWIEAVRKGKTNLLWPTEVKWFAKSSGTSYEKRNFLPVR